MLSDIVLVLLLLPAVADARGLTTGYLDGSFGVGDTARLDEAKASGAGMIRLPISWGGIAPTRPNNPRDPSDPAYNWAGADAAVAAAKERGLNVLLSLDGIPEWAEQGKRPRRYRAGVYKPSPKAVGAFTTAVGKRYRGKARYLQLLNEPNLDTYLAPQWQGGKPFAPVRYRQMLNAAYPGAHAAGMQLVTAGTAPYGDPNRGGPRIRPRTFWAIVFKKTVRFDVLAHHPYAIGGPRRSTYSKDDIAVPDVRRLVALTKRAVRAGKVRPRGRKGYWVTEIGWDSRPPDPQGVPMKRFTRWVADSMFVLWKQGVDHVFWFLVRDGLPDPSFAATRQSGIYFADGRPKPALRAFRFPFACEARRSRTFVWLRAPSSRAVTLYADGRRVKRLSPGGDRIATALIGGQPRLHARAGGLRSISCRV